MGLPDILAGLLSPAAYPHPCAAISVVETHISWVLLTGDYAYKIRKPVRLPFLDFSTLELRRHDCDEELRCNRRFAPELYLEVVPVCRDASAGVTMTGAGEVIEWAVRMRQFPAAAQLDRLLAAGRLGIERLRDFGIDLAHRHARLPLLDADVGEIARRVRVPVEQSLDMLADPALPEADRLRATRIRGLLDPLADRLATRFVERLAGGFMRECHGDLHLANLVLLDDRVVAFDCLEFDANLRWIDVQSDVAFLFMDCLVRDRADFGYAFLDGYLDVAGDYAGLELLAFYTVYRSLVRAKVASIEARQAVDPVPREAAHARMRRLLDWSHERLSRRAGTLYVMNGVSGSGKSHLAARLAAVLPAIRLRSDVARRVMRPDRPGTAPGYASGRYAPAQTRAVYARLNELAVPIVEQGESVILDATFLDSDARAATVGLARGRGWPVVILHCHAPAAVLERRVRQRLAEGSDPSEADVEVLHRQLDSYQPPGADEPVLEIDTTHDLDDARLAEIVSAIRASVGPSAAGG